MRSFRVIISGVDPNTSNLDPDPEFWFNVGPDPGVMLSMLKVNLEEKYFL